MINARKEIDFFNIPSLFLFALYFYFAAVKLEVTVGGKCLNGIHF